MTGLAKEALYHVAAGGRIPHVRLGRRMLFRREKLEAGLRPGREAGGVLALRWSEVDFEERVLHLPETKSGRTLTVPVSDRLHAVLVRHHQRRESEEWVFPGHGKKGHLTTIRNAFKRALNVAGLSSSIVPYSLRHTAGTNRARRGVPAHIIKAMLGHSSIRVTERYLHESDEGKRAAAEILGGIAAPEGERQDEDTAAAVGDS